MARRYTDISECTRIAENGDKLAMWHYTRRLPYKMEDAIYGFFRINKEEGEGFTYLPENSSLERNGKRYVLKIDERRGKHKMSGDNDFDFNLAEAYLIAENPKIMYDDLPAELLRAEVKIDLPVFNKGLEFVVMFIAPLSVLEETKERIGSASADIKI